MINSRYTIAIILAVIFLFPLYSYSQGELGRKSKPWLRGEAFRAERARPFSEIPKGSRERAIEQASELTFGKNSRAVILASQPEWECIGPYHVGGRIRSVVHHPTKSGWLYIAAAAGGVWRTEDGGESWVPLFDGQNSLAFGALAIDPNNPEIIYAGTGENSDNVDSYLGAGIYKTSNAGDSWKSIGLNDVGGFSRIYVHPLNSNLIYAAATKGNYGLWKSTDAGQTWTNMLHGSMTDVCINEQDPNELVVGVQYIGIFHSIDGGASWTENNSGLPGGLGRISVQAARSDWNTWYALMESDELGYIFRSSDRGNSWLLSFHAGDALFGGQRQGWYNNFLEVHPTNKDIVLAGGIEPWLTKNEGGSWTRVYTTAASGIVHVDQHAAAFDPTNNDIVYLGNDGGMFKNTDATFIWEEINNGLEVTQFYALAIDHGNSNRNFGGTQDNGTLGNNLVPSNWRKLTSGDGFKVIIDAENPEMIYSESQHGHIWRFDIKNSVATYGLTKGIPSDDEGVWNAPFVNDPKNPEIFYHGRHAVYVSTDRIEHWEPIMEQKDHAFTAIAVAESNSDIIYAGNEAGQVYITTDAGENWENLSSGLPVRYITDIEIDPENPSRAFLTMSGFSASHVFMTHSMGQSWMDIGTDFPDIPCNAIAINPELNTNIYVATDIGVFTSYDEGASWLPFGRGLPNSPAIDISFHNNREVLPELTLRVATHGRSVWEVKIPSEIVTEPEITIPAGGEKYISGMQEKAAWYGITKPVNIEISYDNGSSWDDLEVNHSSNYLIWSIPALPASSARIRVSSIINPEQTVISAPFSIIEKKQGAILKFDRTSYIPYGICEGPGNQLWTADFYEDKIYSLDRNTFFVGSVVSLPELYYTGISYDNNEEVFYLHQLNSESGDGGSILVVDVEGNVERDFPSPATGYPTGLEYVDGYLLVADRNGNKTYKVNPDDGAVITEYPNASMVDYGPRCMSYDGQKYIYQAVTEFSDNFDLKDAYIQKIDKDDPSTELDRLYLHNPEGMINVRGISYEKSSGDFYITDFGGELYKIAGFEEGTGIEEGPSDKPAASIGTALYPNPAGDFTILSLSAGNRNADVEIILTDLLGRRIMDIYDGGFQANEKRTFRINTSSLAPGLYNILLRGSKGELALTRLVVVE